MNTKSGISLMILVIAVVILTTLGTILVTQTTDIIMGTEKKEFVVELSTIEDNIQEYYLTFGSLPVKKDRQYTASQLKDGLLFSNYVTTLEREITLNGDIENTFYVVDLGLISTKTTERGKGTSETDVFVVATSTLNVYYLNGVELEEEIYFSLVNLVSDNKVNDSIN